jgi:heme-degrading monooxygenase HmoA
MILREWRGRASHANQDAYPEHFRRNVAPELRNVDGFLGARLLRQDRDDAIEYLVLSRWASMEAIKAFAGDDVGKAVVEPGAVAALIDYDDSVRHYSLVEEVSPHNEEPAA